MSATPESILEQLPTPHWIRRRGTSECTGAVLVGGGSDLYTKAIGRGSTRGGTQVGARLSGGRWWKGRPLWNTSHSANLRKTDRRHICPVYRNCIERLTTLRSAEDKAAEALVLHASMYFLISAIFSLCNGQIEGTAAAARNAACISARKAVLLHGGIMVEDVTTAAVVECDALRPASLPLIRCNRRDLSAFVNRLTSLYRKKRL